MSEFSEHWLALRAGADRRARADALLAPLCAGWAAPRRILDLGAGSGANLRYLAPRLGPHQHWLCVDRDSALLAALPRRTAAWASAAGAVCSPRPGGLHVAAAGWSCTIAVRRLDLTAAIGALRLPEAGLVTASALLDLVSAEWLEALLARCRDARCRLLFALTYDGCAALAPAHPDDDAIIAWVNRHQRGDKGFGPALGPAAAGAAARAARALGYRVQAAASDWEIGSDEPELLAALLDGWCEAARALAPGAAERLAAWRRARGGELAAGRLRVTVGHRDLIAVPGAAEAGGRASP